ncbi:MAG: colanic acid exporter, partial [Bacteroidetes bacterium]
MNFKTTAISGARWTTLGTSLRFLLQIGQVLLLARWLDQTELGIYSILLVVLGVSRFFSDLGISQAIIHFQNLTKAQLNALYWLNIGAGGLLFGLLFSLAPFIAQFYEAPALTNLIRLGSTLYLILPAGQQFHFLLQKALAFKRLALIELLLEGWSLFVLCVFLFWGKGIVAVPASMVGYAIAYALVFFSIGRKMYRPDLRRLDFSGCRAPLRYGLFLVGERALSYFLTHLDKIILGRFFGLSFLGAYELAHQLLIRPLGLLSNIGGKITFPLYSKIQTNPARLNHWYLQNVLLVTFIAFPVYFGLLATAGESVRLLFGEEWRLSVSIFLIIGWRGIVMTVGNPIGAYLQALGRTDWGFWANVFQVFAYGLLLILGARFLNWENTLWLFLGGMA